MSTPVIAFFDNKGGVGKTSLVYHLPWMFADRGLRVIAADFDPQCNLTAAFLDEDRLEQVMPGGDHPLTVFLAQCSRSGAAWETSPIRTSRSSPTDSACSSET